MSVTRQGRRTRSRVAALAGLSVMALLTQLVLTSPASAAPYTGGFSPTIIGQKADLNGDSVVSGRDDANAFYGETHIIDGQLDCDAWASANAGTDGDDMITTDDDCTLVGVDGTLVGVTIQVENGLFLVADGPLPFVFNASDPDNPDVGDSDFSWSAINGRVDSNGDETISAEDCHFGLIGMTVDTGLGDATDGADILGNDGTNPCGFANPPDPAANGLVDLNSDGVITAAADTCTNGCFFGHDVDTGVVQAKPSAPGPGGPTSCAGQTATHLGTNATETIVGTSGDDVVVARGGNDTIRSIGGSDLVCAGSGTDTVRAGAGNDRVLGEGGNDFVLGQGANDRVKGGSGRDRIKGGSGRDKLRGQGGRDKLRGQGGADKLNGGPARDLCNGGAGFDSARACEVEQLIP